MTSTSPDCAVCGCPSEQRLCSPSCVREAVHERERNVRHLRALRRSGDDDAGAHLVGRNAELTGALLTQRPLIVDRGEAAVAERMASTASASAGLEELTHPFATPVSIPAPVGARSRPVA